MSHDLKGGAPVIGAPTLTVNPSKHDIKSGDPVIGAPTLVINPPGTPSREQAPPRQIKE